MTKKRTAWKILGKNVIAVAKEGGTNDWAAYIDAVPGINHAVEFKHVMANGDKLDERVARAIFPMFRGLKWRY